jgi:hypothetical protein
LLANAWFKDAGGLADLQKQGDTMGKVDMQDSFTTLPSRRGNLENIRLDINRIAAIW